MNNLQKYKMIAWYEERCKTLCKKRECAIRTDDSIRDIIRKLERYEGKSLTKQRVVDYYRCWEPNE